MYKLFARLLTRRLSPILDTKQSKDQAGFRNGFSTVDHRWTIMHIQQKAEEWRHTIWIAALDFQKAFDSVGHLRIWKALRRQGVPEAYVRLLAQLYEGQSATVRTDRMSKRFSLLRRTKQGDPLRSLLFKAVLEDVARSASKDWPKKQMGIQLGHCEDTILTNLRFADWSQPLG